MESLTMAEQTPGTTLVLHTATPLASLALVTPDQPPQTRSLVSRGGHLEWLPAAIDEMLDEASLSAARVEQLVVTQGPGSFAGVRIALGFAKGWQLAHNTPIAVVGTLQAIALALPQQSKPLMVLLDARRGELFCQPFSWQAERGYQAVGEVTRHTPEALLEQLPAPHALVGNGVPLLEPLLNSHNHTLLAAEQGEVDPVVLAHRAGQLPSYDNQTNLQPSYLRRAEAEEKRLEREAAELATRGSP
uniref:Putative Peptidase M22, glycoprotease n=1 Tax=Magnetococcus massalia (strain MO-1) TaxID=451514 RepID=A0A1S7LK88_MAGMO|nr:putative Peptidase M22, glycoprotease [Candidatus Magnetococcus massalia]